MRISQIKKVCTICQKEYFVKKSKSAKSKYCSKACWGQRNPKVSIICGNCNQEFKEYTSNKRQFCSLKCANDMMKKRKIVKCESCGKEFEGKISKTINGRGKYCSRECQGHVMGKRQKAENNPLWNGGTSQKPYLFNWNNIREKIRNRDNYSCQICENVKKDKGKALPVHHIDYNKENNLSDNLITLCFSCHGKTIKNREMWIKYFKDIKNDKNLCA